MPIKRSPLIAPLSRDHHDGLLLCWKIRTAYRKNIAPSRVQTYAEWFYKTHLLPHFEIEERYMFPILGDEDELVKRAMREHRTLKKLFEGIREEEKNLGLIEEKLDAHIRFEERVLFNEIEKVASPDELKMISEMHSGPDGKHKAEVWSDEFWK